MYMHMLVTPPLYLNVIPLADSKHDQRLQANRRKGSGAQHNRNRHTHTHSRIFALYSTSPMSAASPLTTSLAVVSGWRHEQPDVVRHTHQPLPTLNTTYRMGLE